MEKYVLSFVLIFILPSTSFFAQNHHLDSTFADAGISRIELSKYNDTCNDMILQPDGKIIQAGFASLDTNAEAFDFAMVRYRPDGTFDESFGNGGVVTTDFDQRNDFANSIALQADGKIILGGVTETAVPAGWPDDFALARYLENGELDESFGEGGKVRVNLEENDIIYSLAVQADGKIVVAGFVGSSDDEGRMLARFMPDGSIDQAFGNNGYAISGGANSEMIARKVLLLPDGKILVGGSRHTGNAGLNLDFAIARFMPNGARDNSFNNTGSVTTRFTLNNDRIEDMLIQDDGKILACGYATINIGEGNTDMAMARYEPNGMIDASFGVEGKVLTNFIDGRDWAFKMGLQEDGKILMAGMAEMEEGNVNFVLLRYHTDGGIDSTFGDYGIMYTDFDAQNPAIASRDIPRGLVQQGGGKVIVGGTTNGHIFTGNDFAMARYLTDFGVGVVDFKQSAKQAYIFPNPIVSAATFQYTLLQEEQLSLQLYDLSGQLVQSFWSMEKRQSGEHQELLSFDANLPAGHYFLVLNNAEGSISVKIVKP